ncbi:hypothetical protein K503DRAFT_766946 [Rhizopogon vinicolor AM-OR11-026]|uniref:Uncharacterized protein n=1 Tax=Rhizopogon vinicolor AM-OR11-026 TaxID=1314800 RepID=A0A1B7NBN5_9AGAM|nr:hypothetical protein K503DRAFT_766946 [Rhizopogon vinicolor AM-OR11-026]
MTSLAVSYILGLRDSQQNQANQEQTTLRLVINEYLIRTSDLLADSVVTSPNSNEAPLKSCELCRQKYFQSKVCKQHDSQSLR